MIERVAWPVPPGRGRGHTRPERLVESLRERGLLDSHCAFVAHGRIDSGVAGMVGRFAPGRALSGDLGATAVLSPVFVSRTSAGAAWIDLYDDWSLAPNINPYHRLLAARGYRALRAMVGEVGLVTVNTPYMANLLLPLETIQVPNGVDPALAQAEPQGTSRRRLVMLGEFFPGRTDLEVISRFALRPEFDEVVIGGPGASKGMAAVIRRLKSALGARLQVHSWISSTELGRIVGERTAVLVPHVVSDYTLSQDLLKVYQCLALGARVICPRLLWPASVDPTFGLLIDRGVDLDHVLADWMDDGPPTPDWRRRFVETHTWSARGEAIAAALGE
jgi:hypothetical protein